MKRFLVAVDGSAVSDHALQQAIDLARRCPSGLTIVHVLEPLFIPPDPFGVNIASLVQAHHDYGEEMLGRDAAKARAAGLEVETVLLEGAPAERINELAAREDVEIVVVGSHGRGVVGRALLGSVSARLAHTSRKPLLIVH